MMENVFAALKSDVRRQILVYLSSGDLTLTQIKSRFPFSGPAILYHLRMLEEARFIEHRGAHYTLLSHNVAKAFNTFLSDLCPDASGRALDDIKRSKRASRAGTA